MSRDELFFMRAFNELETERTYTDTGHKRLIPLTKIYAYAEIMGMCDWQADMLYRVVHAIDVVDTKAYNKLVKEPK